MNPDEFTLLFASQIHYPISPSFEQYLGTLNTIYRECTSFIGDGSACLAEQDVEFLKLAEREYKLRDSAMLEHRTKRLKIVRGDVYWRILTSIQTNKIRCTPCSGMMHVQMKRSEVEAEYETSTNKLLELGYIVKQRNGILMLTRKGCNIIKRLGPKTHDDELSANIIQPMEESNLEILLDCRGEATYIDLLEPDVKLHASIAKLPRGDCVISQNNVPVIIFERKTISDLYGSLSDGRISQQLEDHADVPMILLVEDPQLLFLAENHPFHAMLAAINKEKIQTILQTVSKKHTARVYSDFFRSVADSINIRKPIINRDRDLAVVCSVMHDDWYKFLRHLLGDYPQGVAKLITSIYPSYKTLITTPRSSVRQHLLTMCIPEAVINNLENSLMD